jgi:hypothetical protein
MQGFCSGFIGAVLKVALILKWTLSKVIIGLNLCYEPQRNKHKVAVTAVHQ